MARYIGAKLRRVRRLGGYQIDVKSGARPLETKCRNLKQAPGQHGANPRRMSDNALQRDEKQKLRHTYEVLERQFRNYYKKAARMRGPTGENLVQLLESRLDNVVFRMGFAVTRAEARQLVSHKAILVNDIVVNIPSYQVRPGDVVSIRDRATKQTRILAALELREQRGPIEWVEVDAKKKEGKFSRLPDKSECAADINLNLIVELYSK